MQGEQFAKIVEQLLAERGIQKGEFYAAVGISATALYGWKRGAEPKRETVENIEKYFGISLNDIEKSEMDDETAQILQNIRERYDYRAVCKSAIGLSPSQAFEVAAFIERLKEGNEVVTSD